jgi:hypothetical protein
VPAWGVGGQVLEGQGDQRPGPAQPPVVGRGRWQVGEQVAQPLVGEPHPTPFGAEPKQHLGDGQADQFGVAEPGTSAWPDPRAEQVVDADVECDTEGVEVGVHEASQEVDVASATPTLGALVSVVIPGRPHSDSEAII